MRIQFFKIGIGLLAIFISSCAIAPKSQIIAHCSDLEYLQDSVVSKKITDTMSVENKTNDLKGNIINGTASDKDSIVPRTPESIFKVVKANAKGMKLIYEKYLRGDTTLQGKVSIKFIIEPNGNVADAKLVSTAINCNSLEYELIREVKRFKFEKIRKGKTTVTYAFVFNRDK